MIDGTLIKELKLIPDERGFLMEMLRNDDPSFTGFGQVYMSVCYPGVVKGWHYHEHQSDNAVCIKGMIKLVMYDGRENSPTKGQIDEVFLGENRPRLVHIPKGIHHGWKCTSPEQAFVINIVDKVYDYDNPDEHRIEPHNNGLIDYDWSRSDG